MGGKIILFLCVCFAIYWAIQYYRGTKKQEADQKTDPNPKKPFVEPAPDTSDIDKLEQYYQEQITKIENKSTEEIKKAEGTLEYYKKELEKLRKLRDKNQ